MTGSRTTADEGARAPRWFRTAAIFAAGATGLATLGATQINAQTPTGSVLTESDVEVFVSIDPIRFLDTRDGTNMDRARPFGPGEIQTFQVGGRRGIPENAQSVAINVALTAGTTTRTYLTAWPTGTPQPDTAINNARPGGNVPNFTMVRLGDNASFDLFNHVGDADIVIDIVGYYVPLSDVERTGGTSGGVPVSRDAGDVMSGDDAPTAADGEEGDYYIDLTAREIYGPRDEDGWDEPIGEMVEADVGTVLAGRAPTPDLGDIGDLFIDHDDQLLFGPKTSSGWGVGSPFGPDGVGSTFLSGDGDPSASLGVDGDLYLDELDLELFGPKEGGAWGDGIAIAPDGAGGGTGILSGEGAPGPGVGVDGDLYLDISTGDLYGPKTGGVWSLVLDLGPDGAGGGTGILSGEGAPGPGVGVDGDLYLDISTGDLYGPKTGGVWSLVLDLGPDGAGDGTGILSGAGAPAGGLGDLGDLYLDHDAVELYGPKTGAGWGPGVALTGLATDVAGSAVGASTGAAPLITVSLGSQPIAFTGDVVSTGSAITKTDDDTFTINESGTYRVAFDIAGVNASALGSVELRQNSTSLGSFSLVSLGTSTSGTRLVQAEAGDTIELVRTGLVSLGLSLEYQGSMVIELISTD